MRSTNIPLILLISLFFLSCGSDTAVVEEDSTPVQNSKPNILLIIADDMGLDATPGFNVGSIKPNTPNLQNMINNGVRFTNLWSYPTCTPTRGSILTGKYGFRTNVMKVDDVMSTSETSLQKYLDDKGAGYSNAVIGKWHLSRDENHPTQMGVDYYAGLLSGGVQAYTNWNFTQNGATTSSNEYTTTKFTDLAIDWVAQQDKSWFLWLAYNAPHTPFHLPPTNLHTQGSLPTDDASINANPVPYYMAMIEAMDTEIGRLLSSMTQEEKDNTIIIFIGDNGTPNQVVQDYRSRRAKGTVYQGGVNVPMIVSGKNVARSNQTDDSLLNTVDLFATIADIAETGTKQHHDSNSFKELFTATSNSNNRDFAYTEIGKDIGDDDVTIRNESHKYIKFTDGSEALYNLNDDFFEVNNLLDSTLSAEDQQELDNLKQTLNDLKN
ncbi:sulfatase-like hydrolase/transferase [Tenacibaculum sp. S7007]|uniref:Sulfatase-like hydrolase/transferase n=1 Tax=Tenacibaculum pelagium TaxID=2759527 RepID=A0A839ARU4_9FLAO|nr:sulfatase-like hydrolase/transferase [Tenacibaculum pelagium]MBA6156999.1 sulfatase-like hydrolase/transferase [Tenacibaculum pelagium]